MLIKPIMVVFKIVIKTHPNTNFLNCCMSSSLDLKLNVNLLFNSNPISAAMPLDKIFEETISKFIEINK